MERVLQLEDLHHHGVGVREEQPHLREEPPHVEVVGLLHHELGELQRAGADLGGHAHAGLAAVRLERLHKGQEPLQVVDLELEVRHRALAHGPLELGRVHVGVRVLEPLAVHALLYVHAEEGHELLAGRGGEEEALSHVRGARPVQALPDLHARGEPSPSGHAALGGSRSPRGAGSSPPRRVQAREARLVQPAQPSCVFLRQGDRRAGAVGHGQRHCGRVHGVEVQVRDPADGLLGVVVLLAQLIGDEVNGSRGPSAAAWRPRRPRAA